MKRQPDIENRSGIILLEAMLAVAIFAIAVLALGQCMQQCIQAEAMKEEDAHARRLLENRMVEIEAGEQPINETKREELKGDYAGMTLITTPVQVKAKNEDDNDIVGIVDITLDLEWTTNSVPHSKTLEFYVTPRTH